jgi:hypothetical protein
VGNRKTHSKSPRRFQHGGARPRAGRPPGRTKTKVCVSVDSDKLARASAKWRHALPNLVEMLLDQYASNPVN